MSEQSQETLGTPKRVPTLIPIGDIEIIQGANVRLPPSTEELRKQEDQDLDDLANNIAALGLLCAICVSQIHDPVYNTPTGKYAVVYGHRRLTALRILSGRGQSAVDGSHALVPCMVRLPTDTAVDERTMVAENVQRKALAPYDLMRYVATLAKNHTQAEIAEMIGKSAATVSGLLKVWNNGIQRLHDALRDQRIGWDKAATIARLPEAEQEKALGKVLRGDTTLNAMVDAYVTGREDASSTTESDGPKRPSGKQVQRLLRTLADASRSGISERRGACTLSHLILRWAVGEVKDKDARSLERLVTEYANGDSELAYLAENSVTQGDDSAPAPVAPTNKP